MEAVQAPVEVSPEAVSQDVVESPEVAEEISAEPTPPQDRPRPPQKFKLTLDGKSAEATNEEIEAMWRAAQEGRSHAEKSRLMEEQVRQFMEKGKQSPEFLFEQLGLDPDDFAEARVLKKLKEAQMTPAEREAQELRQKLAKYEAEEKRRADEIEAQKTQAAQKEAEQTVDTVISQVIEGAGKTPTPRHIARVAEHLLAMLQDPGVTLTPEVAQKAFKKFQNDLRGEVKDLSEAMSDQELIDMLGEERFNKLLKYDLKKAKKNVPDFVPNGLGTKSETPASGKKPLSFDEWIAQKEKKLK